MSSTGLVEAAILAAGYAPAIGFLHTGKPHPSSMTWPTLFKFETVVPVAFRVAGEAQRKRDRQRTIRPAR